MGASDEACEAKTAYCTALTPTKPTCPPSHCPHHASEIASATTSHTMPKSPPQYEVRSYSSFTMTAAAVGLPPRPRVRDLITGESYTPVEEFDGGYMMCTDNAGVEQVIGLKGWERYTI